MKWYSPGILFFKQNNRINRHMIAWNIQMHVFVLILLFCLHPILFVESILLLPFRQSHTGSRESKQWDPYYIYTCRILNVSNMVLSHHLIILTQFHRPHHNLHTKNTRTHTQRIRDLSWIKCKIDSILDCCWLSTHKLNVHRKKRKKKKKKRKNVFDKEFKVWC